MRPRPSVIFLVSILVLTFVAAETLSAGGRRERKPSPPRPTKTVATALVAAAPLVAVADGPLPVADAVAVGMVATAGVITVVNEFGRKRPEQRTRPGRDMNDLKVGRDRNIPTRQVSKPPPQYDPQPEPWWVLGLRLISDFIDDL